MPSPVNVNECTAPASELRAKQEDGDLASLLHAALLQIDRLERTVADLIRKNEQLRQQAYSSS